MSKEFSPADLEAYVDEGLPPDEMAAIEDALRNDRDLAEKLVQIHGRRDAGIHTLGEIWRRHRLTCPSREQLTLYLDQQLPKDECQYIDFHLNQIHCRLCVASYEDIRISRQADEETAAQRQRILDRGSSYLKRSD